MMCSKNLKLISLALHNYHQKYSCFPPAFVPDEKGQPRHSWRVLILPFLGHQTLYDAYNFDEPWDGPNNRTLLDQRPVEYGCPADVHRLRQDDSCTSYVAVVGPATAWPGPVGKKLGDFADPTSETVLIVDTAGDDIPWTQPRDLTFPDALDQLTSTDPDQIGGHRSEGFFHVQFMGRNAAMVDGSTKFLYGSLSRNSWSQLLLRPRRSETRGGWTRRGTTPPAKLKIGNCIRLGVWIVVALFPLPWVWINPTSVQTNATARATQTD